MIRATTGGVLKSYRASLMNSYVTMNKSMNTILSNRVFTSYAEDPAAAAKAFKLRQSRMKVESQYNICNDTYSKYQTAWGSLDSISKLIDTKNGEPMSTLKGTTLEMLDDPKGDAREQLNKVLDQLSQSIVQNMNQKYGDNFVFAGADGHNVPFEIVDNKLYYRGVSVDAAVPNVVQDGDTPLTVDADGNLDPAGDHYIRSESISTMKADEFDAMDPADQPRVMRDAAGNAVKVDEKGNLDPNGEYVMVTTDLETMSQADYEAEKLEAEKLDYLVNEKYFVDIGLGFQENENNQLIESSGFNAALNGLTFLGYGVDADGDPKNIYSLVQKMRELADSVPEGGSFANIYDEFKALVGKLETAASDFKTEYTNMDASTTKLKNNVALLEDNFYTLQEQYADLEEPDMVESINDFLWAQYAYNAALKVGNSVLSQSLMDYLT